MDRILAVAFMRHESVPLITSAGFLVNNAFASIDINDFYIFDSYLLETHLSLSHNFGSTSSPDDRRDAINFGETAAQFHDRPSCALSTAN